MVEETPERREWRECLENSGIPPSVKDNELDTKLLRILEKIGALVDPRIEDCHRLPSKEKPTKVILKLNMAKTQGRFY